MIECTVNAPCHPYSNPSHTAITGGPLVTNANRRPGLGLILVLLLKSSKLAKVYKLFKLLKITKVLLTFVTMVISVLAYSFMLGPWFAAGFVLMLFIHEMGHVIAMNQRGYPTSAPVFIPFIGAVIFSPPFKNRNDEAYIGFGGPFLGSLAALATFGLWAILPNHPVLLLAVSYSAAFLNLFNLIPIRPLDGGRITQVIGPWFRWVGLAGILAVSLMIMQPSILLIWILILDDLPLPVWIRFGAGATCQVSMMTLMFLGYGAQPWWANGLDMLLATLFNFGFYSRARGFIPEESTEVMPPAPWSSRFRWLAAFLLLAAGLVIMMHYQHQLMPSNAGK